VNQSDTVFGSQSFNGFISRQPGGSSSLAAQSYRAAFNDHAVPCNYALTKVQQHFAGATGLMDMLAAPVDFDPLANLINMIREAPSEPDTASHLFITSDWNARVSRGSGREKKKWKREELVAGEGFEPSTFGL
jgi:hypothetical protein